MNRTQVLSSLAALRQRGLIVAPDRHGYFLVSLLDPVAAAPLRTLGRGAPAHLFVGRPADLAMVLPRPPTVRELAWLDIGWPGEAAWAAPLRSSAAACVASSRPTWLRMSASPALQELLHCLGAPLVGLPILDEGGGATRSLAEAVDLVGVGATRAAIADPAPTQAARTRLLTTRDGGWEASEVDLLGRPWTDAPT